MTEPLDQLTEQGVAGASEAAGEPAWLREHRREAHKRYADQEWPKLRGEEAWVATPFTRFATDVPLVRPDGPAPPLGFEGSLAGNIQSAGVVDLVDGRVASVQLDADLAARGVVLCDLADAARDHEDLVREHLDTLTVDDDRTVTVNSAAWTAGAFLYVPSDVTVELPFVVRVHASSAGAHLPRVLVVLGDLARASVYLEHTSTQLADPTTVDEVVEFVVGREALLDVVSTQEWRGRVGHLGLQKAMLGQSARLRHLTITFGGETVRLRPEARLVGDGSSVEPVGLYFADDGQHFELRPWLDHLGRHTTSDVLYKGALQGRSRTVFRGNIYIGPEAAGTDSNETNKTLILGDGAKAQSTPFLEIKCSDVKAGHGSATGQVDEEHLFYLQSRGIAVEEALRMIVFGFFEEVLARIELPGVRERARAFLENEIRHADLLTVGSGGRRGGREPEPVVEKAS